VTKKLTGWLFEHGYVTPVEREAAVEQGAEVSRDVPRAEHQANLLYKQSCSTPVFDPDALGLQQCPDALAGRRIDPYRVFARCLIEPA